MSAFFVFVDIALIIAYFLQGFFKHDLGIFSPISPFIVHWKLRQPWQNPARRRRKMWRLNSLVPVSYVWCIVQIISKLTSFCRLCTFEFLFFQFVININHHLYNLCNLPYFSVTFKEDAPRKGFFSLHLGMKEMTVNKVMMGLGKSTPKNAVIKPPVFTTE